MGNSNSFDTWGNNLMSCDSGANGFGYLKVEDDMIVSYTNDPSSPTINKFCNADMVQGTKLLKLVKMLEKELGNELDLHEDIDFATDRGLVEMEKKFRLVKELLEESKK